MTADEKLNWQRFFFACRLGTVVKAADEAIWQKRGKYSWQTIGASSEYSADSIAVPVRVISEGVE